MVTRITPLVPGSRRFLPGMAVDVRGKSRAAASARIRAGTVWIDQHGGIDLRVPFGGAEQSGYGPESGVAGLEHLGAPQVIHG